MGWSLGRGLRSPEFSRKASLEWPCSKLVIMCCDFFPSVPTGPLLCSWENWDPEKGGHFILSSFSGFMEGQVEIVSAWSSYGRSLSSQHANTQSPPPRHILLPSALTHKTTVWLLTSQIVKDQKKEKGLFFLNVI